MKTANPPSFKSRWQRAIGESDLPNLTRSILWAISIHFMDEQGSHCFPSIEDIMQVSNLKRRSVIDHLSFAVEKGWLERWHFGKGKANRRWNYQAVIPINGASTDRHQPVEMVHEVHSQSVEMVHETHHKPCRDITMKRDRTMRAGTESALATAKPVITLSEQEKIPRMTKLTDAVIEAAQKTVRQRGVREDLSDAALRHSIEKCRVQKGYCEMTEAAWIETVVQWVGKERVPNGAASRCETVSSGSPTPSPEEIARQATAYEARMAMAEAQHRQRLADYRAAQHGVTGTGAMPSVVEHPADPVRALQALAAKVRMGATAAPAVPVQRPFDPMDTLPARRPPLTVERREALNQVLREMQQTGCAAADLTHVCRGVRDAPEDAWPAVIAQARQRLTLPVQAVA